MADLKEIYSTGKVVRYHANPKYSRFMQTTGDHSWGCAALIFMLNPDPSLELIKAAIFHDSGERWAGDLPYPFKLVAPGIARNHAEIEHQLAKDNGVPEFFLTDEEKLWLKFVDRLECYYFADVCEGNVEGDDWIANNEAVKSMAKQLGVDIKEIF